MRVWTAIQRATEEARRDADIEDESFFYAYRDLRKAKRECLEQLEELCPGAGGIVWSRSDVTPRIVTGYPLNQAVDFYFELTHTEVVE